MTIAVDWDVKHQTNQTNKSNAESMLERLCQVDRKPALAFYKGGESFPNSFFPEPKSNFFIKQQISRSMISGC